MHIFDSAQRLVGGGRPAGWVPTVAKDALRDVFKRVCEDSALHKAINNPTFYRAAAELRIEMMRPFASPMAPSPPAACDQREEEDGSEPATWTVRCMRPGRPDVVWQGACTLTASALLDAAGEGEAGVFFAGRRLDASLSLRSQGLTDGCAVLIHRSSGLESEEVMREHAGGGLLAALDRCPTLPLSTVSLSLAHALNGSAGGGHDVGLMYTEFGGMRKLADGKYYLMAMAEPGAEMEDQGELSLASQLWQFSIGQYAPQPAAAAANMDEPE